MNYFVLLGIAVVIIGFMLKLDAILIILAATIVTGLTAGVTPYDMLTTVGKSFVGSRTMCIFIMVLLVVGTLERNGLQAAAAKLIGKIKRATPGVVIAAYGVMRLIFSAFNIGFGGVAGFVRPIIVPMALGAATTSDAKPHDDYVEQIKGMAAGMENVSWFFGQMLFVGAAGALLVQSTLRPLGYTVDLFGMVLYEIPVAIIAVGVTAVYYLIKDARLRRRFIAMPSDSSSREMKEV